MMSQIQRDSLKTCSYNFLKIWQQIKEKKIFFIYIFMYENELIIYFLKSYEKNQTIFWIILILSNEWVRVKMCLF